MPVSTLHFRSHNLLVTIGDKLAPCTKCASGSCCGMASRFACFFSQLLLFRPGLTPDDLRTILKEMRDKLKVEERGLDVLLVTESAQLAAAWGNVVQDVGLLPLDPDTQES